MLKCCSGLAMASLAGGAVVAAKMITSRSMPAVQSKVPVIPRGTKLGKPLLPEQEGQEVSIVSYNVLCDRFSTPMRLPNVNPAYLAFGYRFELMKREFEELDADIVCLQEATIDRWDDLKAFMADLGYDCVVQLKPHEVKLAVFWRLSKLSLKWWEERSRAVLAELSLGTGAASSPLYIVNVHLEGNPYRGADRVSQLRHALQRLAHHIEASGRDPGTANVALVGDFNSLDCDAPATFLRQGFLPTGYTDDYPSNGAAGPATDHYISHPFQLRDVYEAAQAVPPFTRKVHHRGGARLDFVWATPGLGVGGVLRPLPLEHRDLVERVGLPNYAMPSDHLPVGAVLRVGGDEGSSGDGSSGGEEEGEEGGGSGAAAEEGSIYSVNT